MSSVAVIGSLAVDRVAGAEPRPGGGVYYAAAAAAHLDRPVRIATRCAPGDRPVALEPLFALCPSTEWRPAERTAAFSFHYEGERRVMAVDAVGDPWKPSDVDGWAAAALAGARWVHVAALLRTDFAAATFERLATGGAALLADAQGLVRLAERGPLRLDANVDPAILRTLRALKLSENEARTLAGGVGPDELRRLGVPEIVLTRGSAGALLVTAADAEPIPAEPAPAGVDPTGAGDLFSLAYVAARADGARPVEAARAASATVTSALAAR